MACADWENIKEDSDQEDSHKSNDLKDKRLAKLQKKTESGDEEHKLINQILEENHHP
jgi:hypothetical protein